jgi:hypothetical protein
MATIALVIALCGWAAVMVWSQTGRVFEPPAPVSLGEAIEHTDLEFEIYEHEAAGARQAELEREHLTRSGWIDRQRGVAHIPIERAMEITARRLNQPASAERGEHQ